MKTCSENMQTAGILFADTGMSPDGNGICPQGTSWLLIMPPGTLEQMVGQLDILAQTVALLEQRLSLSEDRNARLEGLLKQALQQP